VQPLDAVGPVSSTGLPGSPAMAERISGHTILPNHCSGLGLRDDAAGGIGRQQQRIGRQLMSATKRSSLVRSSAANTTALHLVAFVGAADRSG
jgi:hypothetical protein